MKTLLSFSALSLLLLSAACATVEDNSQLSAQSKSGDSASGGMGGNASVGSGGSGLVGAGGTTATGGGTATGGTDGAGGSAPMGSCTGCKAWSEFDYNSKPNVGDCATGSDGMHYEMVSGNYNDACGPAADQRETWCDDELQDHSTFAPCQ